MTNGKSRMFYPVFKVMLGVVCLILGIEYSYYYIVFNQFLNHLYVADALTWFLAGGILLFEGIYDLDKIFDSI